MILIVLAFLSAIRLTQIVTEDKILNPVRRMFVNYPGVIEFLSCYRCVSIWTGFIATFIYFFAPWLNLPFAMSFVYNIFAILIELRDYWLDKQTPRITIRMVNGNMDIKLYQVTNEQAEGVFKRLGAIVQAKVA